MTVAPECAVAPASFLETVEGEISFFRSIIRARPVGVHKYFHVLVIQNSILKDTGRLVRIEDIWEKLRSCYDLEALDAIDMEVDGFEIPTSSYSSNSTPTSIPSPSPSENLSGHPFFKEEFTLPYEDFEPLISARRMRDTASAPSSPAPSPAIVSRTRNGRKSRKSKLDMAGLVGGDSDSSALTQESGDEASGTRGSVVTATDGGTEYAEEEDVEMREPSPAPSASPKPARGRTKGGNKRVPAPAPRAKVTPNTRGTKKRKR